MSGGAAVRGHVEALALTMIVVAIAMVLVVLFTLPPKISPLGWQSQDNNNKMTSTGTETNKPEEVTPETNAIDSTAGNSENLSEELNSIERDLNELESLLSDLIKQSG